MKKIIILVMLSALLMTCCCCTEVRCKTEQLSCRLDCPETIGLKQACRQKCNFLYDVCKNK
jgi:hypothetical protein